MKKWIVWIGLVNIVSFLGCQSSQQQETAETETSSTETMEEPFELQATLALDAKAVLGEGAIWHHEEGVFYWIDIEIRQLHLFDPSTGNDRVIDTKERIGTVVPCKQGGALVALQNGIFHVNLETESFTKLNNPLENQENIRFNDGKCDPQGRFWVGSMKLNAAKGEADLYCLYPDGDVQHKLDSVTISNGIVWSSDGKTMYYIDTPTKQVQAFDFDPETGGISKGRVAIQIPNEMGGPDGMAIDAEGNVWIGMWGGFAVTCWNPESGEYLGKVNVPAQNVTACAFGGEDFSTLYITTARTGTKEEVLEEYPSCGSIFAVDMKKLGVKGVAADFFSGAVPQ